MPPLTPAQHQQLLAMGIDPNAGNGQIAAPQFGLAGQAQAQAPAQPQQQAPAAGGFPPWMTALMAPQQQQSSGIDWNAIAQIAHPQSRHLGMGGAEVTQENPTGQVGGIDWLHAHNDGSNGRVAIDPQAQARTQSDMMVALAPQATSVQHQLPWTQIATAPVGQHPGYISPQFPAYQQRVQQQLHNPFAMMR